MYIDSHAHLFDVDTKNIDLSSLEAVIVPSYSVDTIDSALRICNNNDKLHCALGIYPEFIHEFSPISKQKILDNIDKIVCIGEIGLDDRFKNFDAQINGFIQQVEIAQIYNLPISVHLVGKQSFDAFFEIMKAYSTSCVLHAFCGNLKEAKSAIDNGYYISFAGNITYRRNIHLREIAKRIPLSSILIETDSPNILPAVFQRHGINQPKNIHYVASTIAEVRKTSIEEIANQSTLNTKKIFKL